MITGLITGRRWIPLAVIATGLVAHAGMWARLLPCPDMGMTECLLAAAAVVATGSLAAIIARGLWLARTTSRAVAGLGDRPLPDAAHDAAGRAGLHRVACVPGTETAAFTAGLWRPRVYVTDGAVRTLTPAELDAVLTHEAAHAHRRDPLRRLLHRAAADTLFYLPLARWWSHHQVERSELTADRAAIDHAERPAVAGALLTAGRARPSTVVGFDGALDARIAQLTGDPIPPRRPSAKGVAVSVLGLLLMISLMMCLSQAIIGMVVGA